MNAPLGSFFRRGLVPWITVLGVLTAVLLWEIVALDRQPLESRQRDAPEPEMGTTAITAPEDNVRRTPDDYSAIMARPLFLVTRRPIVLEPPKPEPEEPEPMVATAQPKKSEQSRPPPPAVVLKGVIIEASGGFALLWSESENDHIKVEEGQDVDGWTVDTIEFDRILLTSNGRDIELPLYPPEPQQ